MRRCRSKPLVIALIITMVGAYAQPAFAHNEKVHRDMTDYAYEVMLAASKFANGEPLPPDLQSLFKRLQDEIPVMGLIYLGAAQAVPKLRAMPSGLPPDGKPCATPFLINLFGGLFPDFNLPPGTTLADTPLSGVRLPVSTLYSNKNVVCGIDEQWAPSGALADVNPGTFTQRDHTGVTLGYWAGQPDRESGDWRMRSTVLEELKDPANVAGAVAKTTVQISLLCGLACALMPLACLACPILAGGAAGFVADELSSINASQIESPDFCVLGHFMDLKPTPAASFDDVKGKLAPSSGVGQPDALDKLLIATYDAMGLHVNHEASTGPTRYEIVLGTAGATGTDLHRNSLERKPSDWETPLASALEYTPGDNLARFGLEAVPCGGREPARHHSARLAAARPGRCDGADDGARRERPRQAALRTIDREQLGRARRIGESRAVARDNYPGDHACVVLARNHPDLARAEWNRSRHSHSRPGHGIVGAGAHQGRRGAARCSNRSSRSNGRSVKRVRPRPRSKRLRSRPCRRTWLSTVSLPVSPS